MNIDNVKLRVGRPIDIINGRIWEEVWHVGGTLTAADDMSEYITASVVTAVVYNIHSLLMIKSL